MMSSSTYFCHCTILSGSSPAHLDGLLFFVLERDREGDRGGVGGGREREA